MADPEGQNRTFWDGYAINEITREQRHPDKLIHTRMIEQEIDRHLEGVLTLLDVGGGTGRFSIKLARRGIEVVHLDLSAHMLSLAKEAALAEGLTNIYFVNGNLADLPILSDRSFDMVLCLDSPLSYCEPDKLSFALAGLARATRRWLIVTVHTRPALISALVERDPDSLSDLRRYRALLIDGSWQDTCKQFPPLYGFFPDELASHLRAYNLIPHTTMTIGTISSRLSRQTLEAIIAKPNLLAHLLMLEKEVGQMMSAHGVGVYHASGLLLTFGRD